MSKPLSSDELVKLNLYRTALYDLHSHLQRVNRFPHKAQYPILSAFFDENKKVLMGQCGRSYGKTEQILYITWRYALTNPGSEVYIICPEKLQAKKIYWLRKRLQNYGPQKYVSEHRESELRTVFTNGSYIILDGCENYDALRGIKPNLVVYDEFQHHSKDFDEEVMQPNLSNAETSLVVMGTPPKRHCYYVEFRENLLESIKEGNKNRFYAELPSEANPTLDKAWLTAKKQELVRKKKLNVWLREYEGKLVFDTESAVFPFFDERKQVKSPGFIQSLIEKDKGKLRWFAIYDPGTTTCFAVLFACINPYTAQVFLLDEIYATTKSEMTSYKIWERSQEKKRLYYGRLDAWINIYDEAAAWFPNEVGERAGFFPTAKQITRAKEDEGKPGESILNSIMELDNRFFVSSRCEKFIWEMQNFVLDENGKYPKNHDHLVDCLYYLVNNSYFELFEEPDRETYLERADKQVRTLEEEVEFERRQIDFVYGLESQEDYYDYEGNDDLWN